MHQITRPPTRVNKACDRCRRQKQRCDFVRPCQQCVHSQTECTADAAPIAKKRRLEQQGIEPGSNITISQPTTKSYPQGLDWQIASSHPQSNLDPEISKESNESPIAWDSTRSNYTRETRTSAASGSQPRKPDTSTLPQFINADSTLAITRKIFSTQESSAFRNRATFAIPGGSFRDSNGTNSSNRVPTPLIPVRDIIGIELPTYQVCNQLLETYFATVHWFSLVVYEPKFRSRYDAIMGSGLANRNDHGYLLLLLMVLTMGCWYTPKGIAEGGNPPGTDRELLQSQFISVVQRDFMELMEEDSIEFVQVCALLGSFYLYHGRPRSSFSILGAATKTSQAMELHRDSETKFSFEDNEERKRVWWTIYTWDRFATITYGRPLGINDKDCNVSMPSEIIEHVHFEPNLGSTQVCLSEYQCQLNMVYRIASPVLEDIYGIRTSSNMGLSSGLPKMVATAYEALENWQRDLPPQLSFDRICDLTSHSSAKDKAHSLQALSLQLTYHNVMIVLHRPLLADQNYPEQSAPEPMSPNSLFSDNMRDVSFKRCLSSALQISHVQQKQNLFLLSQRTHLVSFLGMNLFTSSVVLFICALSDTLSDTAQEAKRGLKSTFQMQKALSNHASMSMQYSKILEDLVQLVLKKELEEMLCDPGKADDTFACSQSREEELLDENTQDEAILNRSRSVSAVQPGAYSSSGRVTPHPEVSHFKQSLMTLQKVFQDSSVLRQHQTTDENLSTSHEYRDNIPMEDSLQLGGMLNLQDNGPRENTFTGMEDLGQFWLWDVDYFNY